MNRMEALTAATEWVNTLAPAVNPKGYDTNVMKPADRARLIMETAEWILTDETKARDTARASSALESAVRVATGRRALPGPDHDRDRCTDVACPC
jgi:hypothetical protein